MNQIGELNEKPLHAALKTWYAGPDDRVEVPVNGGQRGYVIDLVQDDLLIEIQTGNFSSIKRNSLLKKWSVLPEYFITRIVSRTHSRSFFVLGFFFLIMFSEMAIFIECLKFDSCSMVEIEH